MFLRLYIFTFFLFSMNIFAQIPPIETGVPQTLAKWRAANYSDVRYKLNLTLEKMSPVLKGTMEISLMNQGDSIILDWRKIKGREDASTISNLSVNGKPAPFEEINEHLVLKEGILKNKSNTIRLDFTSPIATSGAAITRYVDKEDGAEYIYSLFVPSDASTAFPVFDQPDLKARFKLSLITPTNWKAVSNTEGKAFEETGFFGRNSVTIYGFEFEETKPISTYVFAFAAGDFAEFKEGQFDEPTLKSSNISVSPPAGKIEILERPDEIINTTKTKIYVRKSQAEKFKQHSAEVFRLNREGVKFLETYFDYKFPFPKYDLVLIPEFPFGGMEHAGCTFLRESSIIFPTEPTKNDLVSRANVIFHEAAHQWFGDTVTMRWFDDLWLKEGFAEFMAYKTMEKVLPEYNAWKIFYERNKQAAYLTDSTRGTTPIYQEIPNLSAAKSAYGNIVYRKAPSFLRQAEFYLGEDKFQTAVRAFLKKHEFANAEWTDLVKEFNSANWNDLENRAKYQESDAWADVWVRQRSLPIFRTSLSNENVINQTNALGENTFWQEKTKVLTIKKDGSKKTSKVLLDNKFSNIVKAKSLLSAKLEPEKDVEFIFPNYQDYGYGIFLLDERSRAYVLENIQTEKDDFLRTMMWGALWDSVRETELAPKDYVELVIKNLGVETDESTIQTLLGRVSTATNYYLSDAQAATLAPKIEAVLIEKMQNAPTLGQRITFYRAFLNTASTENARNKLKEILGLTGKAQRPIFDLKTKDKFDIVTRLLILGDRDAPQILANLEKTETSDEAKRYAYAAKAGIETVENKAKFWNDFTDNKDLSESYIEAAFAVFNAPKHSDLTLPYLEKALAELPNLKKNRKIFFVNGWLAAFIGGQRSKEALAIVNKFLADNPNLDKDLRLKILENSDNLERAVKIRAKFGS